MMELRVEHLCKRYGENTVLDDISFTARVGVTRLLGPSGIGKTTLLRVLLGLETPDSGTVNGDKFRWTAVFQENRLLEGLDAEGNLRFVLGANYNAAAAQALLEELRLGDVRKKKVRDYSGGMQRRLALARALLAPSDAIALDEPFTGLDAENREAAMRAILRAAETKIVILSTHEELPIPVPCQIIELQKGSASILLALPFCCGTAGKERLLLGFGASLSIDIARQQRLS